MPSGSLSAGVSCESTDSGICTGTCKGHEVVLAALRWSNSGPLERRSDVRRIAGALMANPFLTMPYGSAAAEYVLVPAAQQLGHEAARTFRTDEQRERSLELLDCIEQDEGLMPEPLRRRVAKVVARARSYPPENAVVPRK